MKTLKYLIILLLLLGAVPSCVDKKTSYDANDDGKNLAGFELGKTSIAGISDGTEYTFPMKVKIVGPTLTDLTGDITLTIDFDQEAMDAAAEADTNLIAAVEGTHFRIDNPAVVLKKSNNYLGTIDVIMTTDGVITPLPKTPVLILKTVTATGDDRVVNNGKDIELKMNFACFSTFEGSYTMSMIYTSTLGVVSNITRTDDVITKIGTETYRTKYVGHWTPGALGGTAGFTFLNSCNKLTIPEQNLVDLYANIVAGTSIGKFDPIAGTLYMEYSVCYGGLCRTYKCTWTKN